METLVVSSLSSFAFLLLLVLAINPVSAQQGCALTHKFGRVERSFKTCQNLGQQGATLSWTHNPEGNILEVVFSGSAPSPSGWVGWGVNPGSAPVMIGAETFIAFKASNGSSMLLTYMLTKDLMTSLPSPGPLKLKVFNKSVEISGTSVKMYVKLALPDNRTMVNHIWNRGAQMNGLSPLPHAQNDVKSAGRIDVARGTASAGVVPHQKLKNRHGIINAVGWGLLLPLGVMSARYLKSFESADPAWFYIHSFCQSSGYILGVVGWATGLKLGNYSTAVNDKHRNLGIAIFVFATLQVLSLLLRPKKEHKIRKYWNVYHHTIGYSTIAMILVNIFEGFHLLQPQKKWKHAYIGAIAALGGLSLILEIITWIIYFRKSSRKAQQEQPEQANAYKGTSNGVNNGNGWSATPNGA